MLYCLLFFFVCFCHGWETKGFVEDAKGTVEALESINQFFLGNGEWGCAVDVGESVQSDQSLLQKGTLVLVEGLTGGLVLKLGVLALGVLNVETSKETNGAVLLDGGVVLDQLLHAGLEERGHVRCSSDNVVLQEVLGVLVGDRHGDGVSCVGRSPSHGLVLKVVKDFFVAGHHGHGYGGGGNTLGAGDNVGHDAIVILESEHFSGSSKAHHDLVHVHQDSVLVAESTNTLQKSIGENDATTGSLYALGHDGGNVVGSLVEDLFLEHDECGLDLFGLVGAVTTGLEKEGKWVEGLDKVGGLLSEPASGVTGGGARVGGGTVIASVPADDLLLSGEASGHHDSCLVGLGSTAGVDGGSQVSGKNLVHELVHARLDLWLSHVTVDIGKVSKLVFGGLDDRLRKIVSQV